MNSNLLDLTFLDTVSIFAHEHLYIPFYHHPPIYRKPSLSARTPSSIPSSLSTTHSHRMLSLQEQYLRLFHEMHVVPAYPHKINPLIDFAICEMECEDD